MSKPLVALGALAVLAISPNANAAIYTGNPEAGFHIERTEGDYSHGDVFIDKVRIHNCGGGFTDYPVNAWVDPVAGHDVTIAGGDLCAATWYWDSDITIVGPGYILTATPSQTTVNLDPIKVVDVLPYTWKGTMEGNGSPYLVTTVH